MESNYTEEKQYLKARKKVKEIKGFYVHVVVNILSLAIVVTVNLLFVPGFHFFWIVAGALLLVTFIHWLLVFGSGTIGLGKDWEQRKINELMSKNN